MDHAEQARIFLRQSDQEFASNDALQGSEKLWGATAHALMAAEEQNGRRIPGKHRKMFEAINSTIRTSRYLTALLYRFIETSIMTLWKMRR